MQMTPTLPLMQKQIAIQKSFLLTIKNRFWTIDFIVDLMEIGR